MNENYKEHMRQLMRDEDARRRKEGLPSLKQQRLAEQKKAQELYILNQYTHYLWLKKFAA